MDILTFIATLVQHGAWPLVTLIIAVIVIRKFQSELSSGLRRITAVKGKDWQIELHKDVSEIKAHITEISVEEQKPGADIELKDVASATFKDQALQVAQGAPSAAILFAWSLIERQLYRLTDSYRNKNVVSGKNVISANLRLGGRDQISLLHAQGVISKILADKIQTLRQTRNTVAHGQSAVDVAYDDAVPYIELAENVLEQLISIPTPD